MKQQQSSHTLTAGNAEGNTWPNKENNPTENMSNEELEIENGFFTVDDNDEENKRDTKEDTVYTETQVDTIDAAFNSALGVTKGNNSTNKTRTDSSELPGEQSDRNESVPQKNAEEDGESL